jgi:PAS domain S-box-containing protein
VTTPRVALLAAIGTLVYAGALAIALTSDTGVTGAVAAAFAAGFSFTATGIVAVARRPENRTGALMLVVGLVWAFGVLTLTDSSLLFTIGAIGNPLAFAPLGQLLLAYPSGVLERRYERRLVSALWIVLFAGPLLLAFFDRTPTGCDTCAQSAFVVWPSHALAVAVEVSWTVLAFALALAVVAELVRKYRDAGPRLRRTLSPVYAMFAAAILFLIASNALDAVSSAAGTTLGVIAVVFLALVPVAFLAGLLRGRLARGSVLELLVALEDGAPLREALGTALGDPSLEIAYWLGDTRRWVDARGRAVPEPVPQGPRSVTTVEHHGERVAALVHDASLDDEPDLVRGVAAAAALSLQAQRAQAELRNQYEYLATLVDTAPSLLVTIGLDGRILSLNSAVVEASGHDDAAEIRGRYFWDVFIAADEREAMRARFAEAAPDHAAAEYENAFTNHRGEERVIFWRSAPVHDEQGRVISIVAGGLDISERQRFEAEKQRERDFFSAITNATPSFICLIDQEGRVTERGVNAAFERALEWSDLDAEGQLFWERWVDPVDADDVRTRIERTVGGESLGEHDSVWLTRSGQQITVAWTCTPLPRLDERTLFQITGVDVTERQRREEEIRAAEERFRAVVESAPVAIVEIGPDSRVNLWNPAAERIFGWPADEVLGRFPPWVPPEYREDFLALSAREAIGESYTGYETVRMHRDGRRLDVEISAAPIRDATGAAKGAMAVVSDISDRRRQEEEVRASRARIVRTADETRRRLERNLHDGAQQRLVALSVSLRLAEAKLASDPRAVGGILTGAREELALALEELRELARGIHPAVLTERGLAAALEALVARASLPVRIELPDERLPVPIEAALYYVVAESLTNVAKYAGATCAAVRLEVGEAGVAELEVSDDGAGGADPAGGTGLRGLADRVEALDGRLVVDSPAGGGTRVRVEIPLPPPAAVDRIG